MQLKVINSNSSGNAYLLEGQSETLLIECGVVIRKIKEALNFDLRKVVGCLISHEHLDHCKAASDVMKLGINIYSTRGTLEAMGVVNSHRAKSIAPGFTFTVGGFKILPFSIKHDCADPVGYLINHAECGNVLFLTDSYYCEYTFKNLHNVIVEANYCWKIINERVASGENNKHLRDRVLTSHMSLDNCKELLKANDLSKVQNIVLIHLSDNNSDAPKFKSQVQQCTGKMVHIAEPGLNISFNKQPF